MDYYPTLFIFFDTIIMNLNEQRPSCFPYFPSSSPTAALVRKAHQKLTLAGVLLEQYPSAILAGKCLNMIKDEAEINGSSATNIGFIRYSQSSKHHIALSFIDSEGVNQHQDLSSELENNLKLILNDNNSLVALKNWVINRCKDIRNIRHLYTTDIIHPQEALPQTSTMKR